MHLTSYWKQKQETNDKKNTSFEKKRREKKKFWSCEVFEMILLINARTNGIHHNSTARTLMTFYYFIFIIVAIWNCRIMNIFNGKKYNDDDRMKQLPALNKDKVLNEDKPLHMNTDGLFFSIKFGFFFSHSFFFFRWVWFLCQCVKTRKDIQRKKIYSMHVNWSEHEPQTNNKKRATEWTSGREKKVIQTFFFTITELNCGL